MKPKLNKEFLASTSVFAAMANNNVDIQKVINEFIIGTYVLNSIYTQSITQIRDELIKHFDINIPEAVIRIQLKRLTKECIINKEKSQYIINSTERNARKYIMDDLLDKKEIQSNILKELIDFIKLQQGTLTVQQKQEIENNFIEYLFDGNSDNKFSTLISAFIVKNEGNSDFLNELNLIREGATILKGIYYNNDFNDNTIWSNKLTIYIDTEHLLSLFGLNGETYKEMLMDFYDLVREINFKCKSKDKEEKKIQLKYTVNAKNEIENLFYVSKKIINGKTTLKPGKTAIKNIVEGCSESSDITKKESKFFTSLKSMGIYEADEIDLFENPEYNIVDENALTRYSDDKTEDDINKILEEFTFINILRKGINNKGFDNIGHIIMTGDHVTIQMSYDNDLKIEDSDFSFATDVYYITQRLWFKLNKGLGFNAPLPSTLNIVNKARIIISSQINQSVRNRFNNLERDIQSGKRTPEELKEYYYRLRASTISPENITSELLDDQIRFIYSESDLEEFLRKNNDKESVLEKRNEKVRELEQLSKKEKEQNKLIKVLAIENSENSAYKLFRIYKILTKIILTIFSVFIILGSYYLKQESESLLSYLSFLLLLISFTPIASWNKISKWLKKKAFINHEKLLKTYNSI